MALPCVDSLSSSFSNFRWKLYIALLVRALFPAIYNSVRIHILGWNPNETTILDVASQVTWIQILFKICDESILQPLYSCLGKSIDNVQVIKNRLVTGFIVCLVVYLIFGTLLMLIVAPMVDRMAQAPELLEETSRYLKLEVGASMLGSLASFFLLVILINEWSGFAVCALAIQMSVSVTMDIFFVSTIPASLQLGTTGLAYSSIASQGSVLVFTIAVCWRMLRMNQHDLTRYKDWDFRWLRKWTLRGAFSTAESTTRNLVYMFVVLRPFNLLREQATYWLANAFIWNWLLLPVMPLSETFKVDVALKRDITTERTLAYYTLAIVWIFLMTICSPGWDWFLETVLKVQDVDGVSELVRQLSPGYILFSFNLVMLGALYGLGKTHMILIQTIVANVFFIVFSDLMFQGVLELSLQNLIIMFNIGIALAFLALIFQYQYLQRQQIKVDEEEAIRTLRDNE